MNETMLITNLPEKFANARNLCPNMSEEIYALSDYLAAIANDQLVPGGFVMMFLCTMDDLEKKRCGFANKVEFPEYLATHNMQVRAQMPYILQVVDAFAEPEFADAVRRECQEAFHWNVPKRVDTSSQKVSDYDYISAAVDWWTEAIQHPKMDNGDDGLAKIMMMFGGSHRQFTGDELKRFREALATSIARELEDGGRLTLSVDYGPDYILGEAGSSIGLGQFDFPCKTVMWISETEVSVSAGYRAPERVIWKANAV